MMHMIHMRIELHMRIDMHMHMHMQTQMHTYQQRDRDCMRAPVCVCCVW